MTGFLRPQTGGRKGIARFSPLDNNNFSSAGYVSAFHTQDYNDSTGIVKLSNTQVQLKAGKKYKVTLGFSLSFDASRQCTIRLRNDTTGEALGPRILVLDLANTVNLHSPNTQEYIVAPTVDTTYSVLITPVSGTSTVRGGTTDGESYVIIEELEEFIPQATGSTAINGDLTVTGVVNNAPVYAHYTESGGNTLSNTSVLRWDTEVEDTHNAVTTGSGWKFTAPIAGLYHITCLYSTASTAVSAGHIYGYRGLFLNGSSTNVKALALENVDASITKGMRFACDFYIRLAVNDYFQIQALASASIVQSNDAAFNWIHIIRVSS